MRNNLSMIMGKKRVTATKLSEDTGVSRTTIHELYHEKQINPSFSTVLKLCKALDVTLNEFFGIDEKEGVK
ncbi:helix-turn-helix domain-containing protein [Staphylococcus capitis]|uniref:helix-turn-helix domain-containing protein n=1 Tax=Staphylococcus capitis TaxID=29388 RepID=UPI000974EE4D|nr:helix-turn-helix transcriptional regulator [Staphylococcus capitis]MCG1118543.1 helix-turn-helix transcriptional regulator [Staphylococcus epidermidis]MCG1134618.1 helix-turn-helix transcriptional regulator [Staphylococcus epidermidis]NMK73025.1 helix-turn-helix transcriptional regulator [Staphylococcus capitis]BAW91780.1 pathogenicity island protein [Staphylococcus capitis]